MYRVLLSRTGVSYDKWSDKWVVRIKNGNKKWK